ncbi:unnamed protein product [Protopolystoma xenopodis]|uniref:Uncharacterized protein n=1 Tax=Protopolystoma xenopodis TaxID=117903 RepID=A0A3S5AJQ0_9PLAT|nr:unnamed protein product [Protopolystoma xenopodis]
MRSSWAPAVSEIWLPAGLSGRGTLALKSGTFPPSFGRIPKQPGHLSHHTKLSARHLPSGSLCHRRSASRPSSPPLITLFLSVLLAKDVFGRLFSA